MLDQRDFFAFFIFNIYPLMTLEKEILCTEKGKCTGAGANKIQCLGLINRAGGLYGRILTEVASTD